MREGLHTALRVDRHPCFDSMDPQLLGKRLAHGQIFGMGQATGQWVKRFKRTVL
jgi:hypothetical protein